MLRRGLVALTIRKNFVDIPPSIEHSHDFGPTILQPIKYDLWGSCLGAQASSGFVAHRPANAKSSRTATAFAISRKIRSAGPRPAASA
jgi:hypothetical protein